MIAARSGRSLLSLFLIFAGLFLAIYHQRLGYMQRSFLGPCTDGPPGSNISEIYVAPDGARTAYLCEEVEVHAYWVTVCMGSDKICHGVEVFGTWNFAPRISWIDAQKLAITLEYVSPIGRTFHDAEGVTIEYRIVDKLLEHNVLRDIEDFERRRLEEMPSYGKPQDAGIVNNNNSAALANNLIWKQYKLFKKWIDRHVVKQNNN